MPVTQEQVTAWLERLAQVYAQQKELLTALDAAIGDADHGINMERGFGAVRAELLAKQPGDLRSLFQIVAATLIRTVGGASGPLYGTFFLRASAACPAGATELDGKALAELFGAGVEGVQQRGRAAAGEKTMLDALLPAVDALRRGGTIAAAATAAEDGARATVPMQARKGRASYLGERSIGHPDPGATSAALFMRTAAEVWHNA